MALIVVIIVALLSLSTVETRASKNGQAKVEAQSNARLALMMAVGELQKELGPDTRISAPHDAGTLASDGQPHWVAVYDAWERNSADASSPETPGSRNPEFRTWLASGANQANGGLAGTSDLALLVGPNSLSDTATVDDEVRVPMYAVSSGRKNGRVAWWTSDESVKAKVNAGPSNIAASSYGVSDPLFDSQSPPYINHRVFPEIALLEWEEGERDKTLSTDEVNLAAELGGKGVGNFSHELTVHSAGVLADVRSGRLKRDLSNLLSRPVEQLEDKPLYLANGRMNWFNIDESGNVSNSAGIPASWSSVKETSSEWGINLEELFLFHSVSDELVWSGGSPSMEMPDNREDAVADRHYLYKKLTMQALQFIFSLQAVQQGNSGKYKMVMRLDGMVAVRNPNDVPLVYTPGLELPFQISDIPYDLKWNIERESAPPITTRSYPTTLDIFRGYIEGGATGTNAAGFTIQAGEAAVFGSSTASGFDLNLRRGFVPSGGVLVTTWNLRAENLDPDDKVDFQLLRIPERRKTNRGTSYGVTSFNTWIGPRQERPTQKGWQTESMSLNGLGNLNGDLLDESLPPVINPSQVRPVSEFVAEPQPIMMLSFLQNVEQSSGEKAPDSIASRPFMLGSMPVSSRGNHFKKLEEDRHNSQILVTAEPMNYQFRTLAAGDGGRNIYVGGGRQPGFGGSFNVISRRIPYSPPLSIGAFKEAVAAGFCGHFRDPGGGAAVGGDSFPSTAVALCGRPYAKPPVAQAIGNSHGVPHISPEQVFSNARSGTTFNVTTDHSWMVNTALWDSWFLSGIVDGTGSNESEWMTDTRSPRQQFMDLAEDVKPLRNKRFVFHPSKTPDEAANELFNGAVFKNSAINLLPKYLLVDGAFNVNSTSVKAWAALLSSVRDQELLTTGGSTKQFANPFGTLGYAVSTETDSNEGDWMGLRSLSDTEIETLAAAIVTEVKDRGPFLSMADFVNRRPNSSEPGHQVLGALQSAIDKSGLNANLIAGGRAITSADFGTLDGSSAVDNEPAPARAVASPGHLSQADLLTAIGPQITVRSDTFTIRAYGESLDSSGTKVEAKAWCEAVVQRVPEYVDVTDEPEAQDGWPSASDSLSVENKMFGRRFKILSFRWLRANEV